MASYLKPRRGKASTARQTLSGTGKLKNGEVFFEAPDAGVGKGQGRLMMGDGTTDYSLLNAFLAFDMNNVQTFNNVEESDTNPVSNIVNNIHPASTLAHNLSRIKQALLNMNANITKLNEKTATIEHIRRTPIIQKQVILNNAANTYGWAKPDLKFRLISPLTELYDANISEYNQIKDKTKICPIICGAQSRDSVNKGLVQIKEITDNSATVYVFGSNTDASGYIGEFVIFYTILYIDTEEV